MVQLMITVVDGQGGRLGAMLIERLKAEFPDAQITAIGTNSIATAAMLRSGAHRGATGEYPLVCAAEHADYILGPVGAAIPASLTGEVTPVMAEAIGRSRAHKVLVPGEKCLIHIAGTAKHTMSEYASIAVNRIKELEKQKEGVL